MLVKDPDLRCLVGRAFTHGVMKKASRAFAAGGLPPHVQTVAGGPIPAPLRRVAHTFVNLQESRHEADYKTDRVFTRVEARLLVNSARTAFQDWRTVRQQAIAKVYLASLVLWDEWDR
jgi:hypothetical protein